MSTENNDQRQILASLSRLEGLVSGMAEQQRSGVEALHRRIDDKFGAVQVHLARQDERLDRIETRLDKTQSDAQTALAATKSASRAGAISGAGVGTIIAAGVELAKAFLKP